MTVNDLIFHLSDYPSDMIVLIRPNNGTTSEPILLVYDGKGCHGSYRELHLCESERKD